ncbi:hypothetical protein SCP_0114160 [Sparassis crispa]|uniref:Uncharacterized protein n=1 Tax=Sparassis crispa TaxID=139825 RepID=A0A401G8P3_9APHY|nr:hypothetical protein SCP_0114160 [Sparassis crispa]GBE78527.1 hypothetical protein SCP_0114160 [Sparassis crispa]
MPPKGHARKASSAKDAPASIKAAKHAAMPPPPVPPPPLAILEAEMNALSSCLRNATVKTGQIYGFYADVKRLGVHKYAPYPPSSLTSGLGREIEKYDQLCDAMESHLLRAITVLRRDISREERRIEAEEAAASAAKKAPPPVEDVFVPSASTPPGSPSPSLEQSLVASKLGLSATPQSAKPISARRQSTISLSSLQRPVFPHKLDLSAAALRMNPEEILRSGLSSPVTLAPKSSARALPPDLLVAALSDASGGHIDIDLTADMDMQPVGQQSETDPALGSSADKPIELDLDMDMDLFTGPADVGTGESGSNLLYQPGAPGTVAGRAQAQSDDMKKEDEIGMDLLDAFTSAGASGDGGDLFASLDGPSETTNTSGMEQLASTPRTVGAIATPSPGSILASFGTSGHADISSSMSSLPNGHETSFDLNNIDLLSSHLDPGFFDEHGTGPDMSMMEMAHLFSMDTIETEKTASSSQGAGGST